MPSVVYYGENEKLVGTEAFANAAIDPKNTIISVKRLIGRSLADVPVLFYLKLLMKSVIGDLAISPAHGRCETAEARS